MKEGYFFEDGKTCYKKISSPWTWSAAREYCQKEFRNGDLAAVSNWKIKQFLENVLTKESIGNGLWIGGSKVDGHWQWSNGDSWDFESWHSGEPNPDASKEENFIRIDSELNWNDYPSAKSFFLCEWKTTST